MTNEEAKEAFFSEVPVRYDGIYYPNISAIICRKDAKKNIIVSAELIDKNNNSRTIARTKDIEVV